MRKNGQYRNGSVLNSLVGEDTHLPSHPRPGFASSLFPLDVPTAVMHAFLISTIRAIRPAHFTNLDLITLIILYDKRTCYETPCSSCISFRASVTSSVLVSEFLHTTFNYET